MSGDLADSIIDGGRFFGFAGMIIFFSEGALVFFIFFSLKKFTKIEDEEGERLRICDCQVTTTSDYILAKRTSIHKKSEETCFLFNQYPYPRTQASGG
jgi:hypothetical protein